MPHHLKCVSCVHTPIHTTHRAPARMASMPVRWHRALLATAGCSARRWRQQQLHRWEGGRRGEGGEEVEAAAAAHRWEWGRGERWTLIQESILSRSGPYPFESPDTVADQHVQLSHTTHSPSAGPGAVADQHLLLSGPRRCSGTHGYICMPGGDRRGGETVRGVRKVGEFQYEYLPRPMPRPSTHSPCILSPLSACMHNLPPPHACTAPPLSSACMRRPSTSDGFSATS